ncbi:MAG: DUF3830 family protein [Tissierellales bacterium]|jgi:hypothetical protein|nr:DUF3830 family protein [Tissierellales bacterium]
MDKLKLIFEKGGVIYVDLFDDKSEFIEKIKKIMPIKSQIYHTRWCGREIYVPIKADIRSIRSDLTRYVSKFDFTYWRNDDGKEDTISIFYGAESLGYYKGPLFVEILGRVSPEQESILDEIGERIWLEGIELVNIELADRSK